MFGFSLNPVDWVTSAAGAIVGGVTDGVFDALTGWVEKGLAWFAQQIATLVTDFGNADLSDGAYAAVRSMLLYVAIAVVIGTIMLATAGAALSKRIDLDDVVREIPVTLAMIAGWGAVCSLWFGLCQQLTVWALSDTLHSGFSAGLSLDAGIASFFRFLIAALMTVALIFFALEMLFIGFLGPFAAAIGPVSLALRPWPHLRDVAKRMVMNLVLLSLTPFLTAAAMSLAMRNINSAGVLGLGQALKGVCGMLVAVLMPSALKKFLPLDGQGGGVGRAMLAAAAATTAAVAGMVATGGASAAAGAGQLAAMAGGPPGGMPPGGTFAPTGSSGGGGPAVSPSAGPSPAGPSGPPAGSSGGLGRQLNVTHPSDRRWR